jgi:BCD family chlorophyll transporter-like MFS transporter
MNRLSERMMRAWAGMGSRFLPFADAATPELPLGRLLRLSLFQVSVGMALVLVIGTLNRVMIVELGVPTSLVALMIALPLTLAPFRALIGFRSDHHRSELGWRRVPFIYRGTLMQFGGLSIMPFALLVLAGAGAAAEAPAWLGLLAAALAFLLVGLGLHTVQTAGLALATDLASVESRPRVVGLMYVALLVGMIASALLFGAALEDFTPGRLVQVIQASAIITVVLNGIALWKQEPRGTRKPQAAGAPPPLFREAWARFTARPAVPRQLLIIAIGTMAFGMADVLIEPYGGQVLALGVGATTKLTATVAFGSLVGFALASRTLARGADPFRLACAGAAVGVPAFMAVSLAAPLQAVPLFVAGILFVGFGAGLFGHGTLTATMNGAPEDEAGLALGAWGAAQATAAGTAIALGGLLRDALAGFGPAGAYQAVYGLEVLLLLLALWLALPLLRPRGDIAFPIPAKGPGQSAWPGESVP